MGAILQVKDKDGNIIDIPAFKGKDGKSAYEIAVDYGYSGTEEEWAELLQKAIDDTHTHSNSNILNLLGENEGSLTYNGSIVNVGRELFQIELTTDDGLDLSYGTVRGNTLYVYCYSQPDNIPSNIHVVDIEYYLDSSAMYMSMEDAWRVDFVPYTTYYSTPYNDNDGMFVLGSVYFPEAGNTVTHAASSYNISKIRVTYYIEGGDV